MSNKYIKKPILPIEAVQWKGNNRSEISSFCSYARFERKNDTYDLYIVTDTGKVFVQLNDWIVKGPKNTYYPYDNDVFTETYELYTEE